MPYKFDTKKMKIPREQRKNVKLSLEDRKKIADMYKTGYYSQRQLAEMFGVSKKTIYMYVDETGERAKHSQEKAKERNKRIGYKNYEAIKRTREYRKMLYKNGKLEA